MAKSEKPTQHGTTKKNPGGKKTKRQTLEAVFDRFIEELMGLETAPEEPETPLTKEAHLALLPPDKRGEAVLEWLHTQPSFDDSDIVFFGNALYGAWEDWMAPVLEAIVTNPDSQVTQRLCAISALAPYRPELVQSLFEEYVAPPDRLRLFLAPFTVGLGRVLESPGSASHVYALLDRVPEEERFELMCVLGNIRRGLWLPADVIWGPALRAGKWSLEILKLIIEGFVLEAEPEGEQLLAEVLEECENDAMAQLLRSGLMRLRTKRVESDVDARPDLRGRAFVSAADGQGAFSVRMLLEREDGKPHFAEVVVRASEGIRDGTVLARVNNPEELITSTVCDSQLNYIEIPLGVAAHLINTAERIGKENDIDPPSTARVPLRWVRRIEPEIPREVEAPADARPDKIAMGRLFDSSPNDAWYLDFGDVFGRGVPKNTKKSINEWRALLAKKLDTHAVRARFVGMARHQTLWYRLSGDTESAEIMAAAAADAKRDFAKSVLLELMVTNVQPHKLRWLATRAEKERPIIGKPDVRKFIILEQFSHVIEAGWRDLAILDHTEAVYLALEHISVSGPGENRPRTPDLMEMAKTIAETIIGDETTAPADPEKDGLLKISPEPIESTLMIWSGLTATQRKRAARAVAKELEELREFSCRECRVGCLWDECSDYTALFHDSNHPAHPCPF